MMNLRWTLPRAMPFPSGGLVFNGGTQFKGDKLILHGSADYDNVSLTNTHVNLAGAADISYSQIEFFGFDFRRRLTTISPSTTPR